MANNNTDLPQSFAAGLDGVSSQLTEINALSDSVARSLSNAFRGAITDGKSFNSLLGSIAKSFTDIALKAALRPLGNLVSGAIGSLFTATNPTLGGVKAFAKGGVIAAPTYFPMSGGTGLAGEAGPEAIMPLTRGSDGSLGVASSGRALTVNFNVTATDAKSFTASEAEVSAMLLRAVRRGSRAS